MKDITLPLRVAIVAKLRNNVSLSGNAVKVYGRTVPSNASGTYIYIPTQNSRNGSAKGYFSTEQTVNIEIVYRDTDGANSDPLDIMTNQVLEIMAVSYPIDMPQPSGFGIVDFEFRSSNTLDDFDGVNWVYRRILTFEAIVDE